MADGLMANPYAGLLNLGLSPEQAQAEVDRQRALQFANLNPQQRMAAGIYGGLTQVSRALGAKDPMLEQASQMRALAQQFDTTTAEGLMQYAQALQRAGNMQGAQAAAAQAQQVMLRQEQLSKTKAELGKTRAETEEIGRKAAAASAAVRSRAAALQKRFPEMSEDEALGLSEDSKVVADLLKVPKEQAVKTSITVANGRRILINDATGETIKDLGVAGKTLEESLGEGLGALGKIVAAGQKKEAEETGQFAAKDFNTLGNAVAAGTASKRNITVLDNALKNAFTGSFADAKTGIIKGFDALGVPVNQELRQAASNTELINAMGTRYVFPLVKNFPGSLAAKELDRLEKTSPNALQQPETIRSLVDLLKVDLAENEFTYNKAKAYKEANKGSAIGFNQADAKIDFQNKLTSLRQKVAAAKAKGSLTAEEKKEIEALKNELGVQ